MSAAQPARNTRLVLVALVLLAFAWRIVLATLTPVPSEDGASYLWMAQQFARGDFTSPLGEVFPPLLPLVLAGPLACLTAWSPLPPALDGSAAALAGAERAFRTGQVVLACAGALAVVPMVRLSALLGGAGDPRHRYPVVVAGLLAALPGLPARYAAEIYTEPAFALAIAAAAVAALGGAFWRCGVWSGIAFWLRGEALLLPLACCLLQPARAWRSVAIAGVAVVLLGAWRCAAGHGFDPLPKLTFNWSKANAAGDGAGALLGDLLALPGAWLEAFGIAGMLGVVGLIAARRDRRARPLLLVLALALVVIVAFTVRRRFLVAWWPLIVPFAMLGLARMPAGWRLPIVAAALGLGLVVGLHTTDPSRLAERDVAANVRAQLAAHESLASDMTRVLWYAGARPLPPRHCTAAEIAASARAPGVRYLVLGSNRATAEAVRGMLPEFHPVTLPAGLAARAAERGIEVRAR